MRKPALHLFASSSRQLRVGEGGIEGGKESRTHEMRTASRIVGLDVVAEREARGPVDVGEGEREGSERRGLALIW
jgi:hypothetical protein